MTLECRALGRTGLSVSALSLGGAALGQQYGPISNADAADTIHAAMDVGINFLDTSAYYGEGLSETIIGDALAGGRREQMILCTKAGRLGRNRFDFSAAGMRECLEGSLRRLRTDCVDVLLAHDVEFATDATQIFDETAEALHRFKAEGKCRFVGMSCYPLELLRDVVERCSLDVVISYCHFTLQNQRLLTELLPTADRLGVGIVNASPLAMGLLTPAGPPPWHPAPDRLKTVCREVVETCRARSIDLVNLGMQFCYREARICSTITGTAKRAELEANILAIQSPINETHLAEVQALLAPIQNEHWSRRD